ncbi:MAG: replicative DNA helicase [Candidatus Dormiibacterota bacterium]
MSTPPQELRGLAAPMGVAPAGRVLPHDLDAEQAVLGCLLIDADAINQVRDILAPRDFYAERNAAILRAAMALSDRGEPVDILTLKVQLERDGTLARSGGLEYLAELSQKMPTAVSVRHYAQIVVDRSLRRRLIAAGGELAQLGFEAAASTDEILDIAERSVFSIADSRRGLEVTHIAQLLTETWELMERRAQSRQIVHGVPTNYSKLDSVTQGLQPGELIILAARPSVGKTSFALNITRNAAVLAKRSVAVFSLEMSKQALVQRLICSEAKVDAYLISTGQADSHAFQRIADAMDRLSQANVWIDDTPALPINELRARARRMKAQQDVDLVVVDYLQLMRGGRQESRVAEVSDISSGLKSIAKELQVPVLALSQLSRESERRENRKPQLSDLRDSGCLTGDSLVWLADACRPVPIRDLVGREGFEVLALNPETWLLESRRAIRAFPSGVKPVFRLQLRSGRSIRASSNHRFLTMEGWRRLDELSPGTHLATPRWLPSGDHPTMTDDELALLGHLIGDGCTLPRHVIQYTTADRELADLVADLATRVFGAQVSPRICAERHWYQVYLPSAERLTHGRRNPIAAWLDGLGVFGLRSYEKWVPDSVFSQTVSGIGVFLRHLWATDGCIHMGELPGRPPGVYYATSSRALGYGVRTLLLQLNIASHIRRAGQPGNGRDQYHVRISGGDDLLRFFGLVGGLRPGADDHIARIADRLDRTQRNPNRDVVPAAAWKTVVAPAMQTAGMTGRELHATLGTRYNGSALMAYGISRERAERLATALGSEQLFRLAESDIYWDGISSLEADGEEDVYDLSVEGLHNFIVNDIIVHNSIEQDADVVLFLYRPGMHKEDVDRSVTELLVEKNRNGPTTKIDLHFQASQMTFYEPTRE